MLSFLKGAKFMDTGSSSLAFQSFPDHTLLKTCVAEVKDNLDEYPVIEIYGRVCHQRRCVGFFSDETGGYNYSNRLAHSKSLTPALRKMMAVVNSIYATSYNGILVNKYNTGNDYISAHSDSEQNCDVNGVVAISYGATRNFRVRDKITKAVVGEFPLVSGSMLQMAGKFQQEFTHEIPIEKRVKGTRLSFTFRKHTRS